MFLIYHLFYLFCRSSIISFFEHHVNVKRCLHIVIVLINFKFQNMISYWNSVKYFNGIFEIKNFNKFFLCLKISEGSKYSSLDMNSQNKLRNIPDIILITNVSQLFEFFWWWRTNLWKRNWILKKLIYQICNYIFEYYQVILVIT